MIYAVAYNTAAGPQSCLRLQLGVLVGKCFMRFLKFRYFATVSKASVKHHAAQRERSEQPQSCQGNNEAASADRSRFHPTDACVQTCSLLTLIWNIRRAFVHCFLAAKHLTSVSLSWNARTTRRRANRQHDRSTYSPERHVARSSVDSLLRQFRGCFHRCTASARIFVTFKDSAAQMLW